jgi:hypothetical protein
MLFHAVNRLSRRRLAHIVDHGAPRKTLVLHNITKDAQSLDVHKPILS